MTSDGGSTLEDLLLIARRAAISAAATLVGAIPSQRIARDPMAEDLVTDLDLGAEAAIRDTILSCRPDDGFIGEELGAISGQSGVEWIVDPVDGTINYIAGMPHWATSIAARVADRVEVAIVHAPELECTYTALAGTGVWRNGLPLVPRRPRTRSLERAVVATGFSARPEHRDDQLDELRHVLGIVRDVRSHGAASLELCAVAVGEIDAYYESNLRCWDIAAGALVATEAGIDVSGSPWSGEGTLVAGPAGLAGPLRQLVAMGTPVASVLA